MTNTSELSEDHHEFAQAVHQLVRVRHHQGDVPFKRAVDEAARMQLRFCETCGQETAYDDGVCVGCGHTDSVRTTQAAP